MPCDIVEILFSCISSFVSEISSVFFRLKSPSNFSPKLKFATLFEGALCAALDDPSLSSISVSKVSRQYLSSIKYGLSSLNCQVFGFLNPP